MFRGHIVKVVIPALDEAASIGKVLAAVPEWVDETIVVDNGSTDDTPDVAARAGARVVAEPRRGYGSACLAGLAVLGRCDVVVFLDADFSDYPDQMDRLVEPIAGRRADMVIGSRAAGRPLPGSLTTVQRFGNALACRLMNLFWQTGYTDLGPFRAIRRRALRGMRMSDRGYGWTIEMQIKAARMHLRVDEVPVSYRPRLGQSKISGTLRGAFGAGAKILWTVLSYALGRPKVTRGAHERIIVFTRYPEAGRAKTRLIPALGAVGAARLQRRMTQDTLAVARDAERGRNAEVEVRYAGGTWRKMYRWLGAGVRFARQGPGDLGRRMGRALTDALDGGCERAVLIGTDCPDLSVRHIHRALDALNENDVVLGPSRDGGYWLVGIRDEAAIFDSVPWGTSTVLERTVTLAYEQGLSVHLLDTLADVDTPNDLGDRRDLLPPRPYLSVIVPALNEVGNIERALRSATGDVETIVVDGGSRDGTAEAARRMGAHVETCRPGRAGQMNRGGEIASGEVLLFLHADTQLPEGYAAGIFDAMSDPGVVGGAFRHATDLGGAFMAFTAWMANFRACDLHLPYGDQAIFVRRDVFQSLGGFADVPIAEDLHFIRRLACRGRLTILPARAITSGRRWATSGRFRTMLINQIVVAGCYLGVNPSLLARLRRGYTRQSGGA